MQSLGNNGILTIGDANHRIQARKKEEEKKAQQKAAKRTSHKPTKQGLEMKIGYHLKVQQPVILILSLTCSKRKYILGISYS